MVFFQQQKKGAAELKFQRSLIIQVKINFDKI